MIDSRSIYDVINTTNICLHKFMFFMCGYILAWAKLYQTTY
jgi:hypothetical protein